MARELGLWVKVEGTDQAVRDLGRVDRAVDDVSTAAKPAATHVSAVGKSMDTTSTAASKMGTAFKVASGVMSALAASQIVQMLTETAGRSVRLADEIADLSAQLNVSASSMIKMTSAAELSGVAAKQLTDIMSSMVNKIAGGDKSAAMAVRTLGLDFEALKRQQPDQMFMTIVASLGKVDDANERTRLAFEVFGKGATSVLRLVNDDYAKNVAEAKSWSDSTNASLENASENWQKFQQTVTIATGTAIGVMVEWTQKAQLVKQLAIEMASAGIGNAVNTPFALTAPRFDTPGAPKSPLSAGATPSMALGLPTDAELKVITAELTKQTILSGTTKRTIEQMLGQAGWDAHVAKLRAESQAMGELAIMSAAAAQGLASVAAARGTPMGFATQTLSGRDVTGLGNAVSLNGFVPTSNQNPRLGGGGGFGAGLNWGAISQQVVGAFSGGNVGGGLGSIAGGIGGTLAASGLGLAAGSLLGSAIPVVGTLIGGFLGKKLGGLFGPSKNALATQEANKNIAGTQGGLLDQFGSVSTIAGMNTAGAELAAGWGSKGVAGQEQFNKLVAEFQRMTTEQNALLDEQATKQATLLELEQQRAALADALVPKWAEVSKLLEKYGISLDAAGSKVQQMATTASFTEMINDIETMNRAGVDTGSMLVGMADKINKAVADSVKFGTEIPANMKPYIEELARAGKLTTDITTIKFGAAVKTEADVIKESMAKLDETIAKLGDRLKEIADLLARMLPEAAKTGAEGVQAQFNANRPTLGVDVEYNDPGYSPDGRSTGPEGFADGSGGLRDFGRGTLAMLHDREAVVTEAQWRALSAGGGSGRPAVSVQVDARGSFFDTEAAQQRMADKLAGAIMLRMGANTAFTGMA